MNPRPPRKIRSILRQRAGATAIEFAILLPVLLAFVVGLIDTGRVIWTQVTLNHAVEAAARCGAIGANGCATEDGLKAYAVARAAGLSLDPSVFELSLEACGKQVAVSHSIQMVFPWAGSRTITLEAAACFPT